MSSVLRAIASVTRSSLMTVASARAPHIAVFSISFPMFERQNLL